MEFEICPVDPDYRNQVDGLLREAWAGPIIVTKERAWDTSTLPGFAAVEESGVLCGAATYRIGDSECEITSLNSLTSGQGIGSALISAVLAVAMKSGCGRLFLVTTNDNTHAIRFYQKFGFSLKAVHIGAMDESRRLKPSIPLVGIDGIPLLHEFEFEILL